MKTGYRTSIIAWSKLDTSSPRNFVCLDTRSREVRHRTVNADEIFVVVRDYDTSAGREYFIAREDNLWYIYGFLRLLLPEVSYDFTYAGLWNDTALIRELHVYGQMSKIGESDDSKTQHTGLGRKLVDIACKISHAKWYQHVTVISGVWVKWYYAKLWFARVGTYMSKKL